MVEQQALLALPPTTTRPGFRLAYLEVYNWGTFNKKVWRLSMAGDSALLTGANGAGKSTVVDAITTLLVPSGKHEFNKAAGADSNERSLRSYVLGYYKSERNDLTGQGKPKQLRDTSAYTVLLAVLRNEEANQAVTLAQVMRVKDGQNSPDRIYACAGRELTITEHFSNFGTDLAGLKKKLRAAGVELPDSFKAYCAWFCQRFGLSGEQPLELFNQAISMKSVGNLTTFVREQMLPPFAVGDRITKLIAHFDDLTRAHDAVLKAKRQVTMLEPIVTGCATYAEQVRLADGWREAREGLKPYFARLKIGLIDGKVREFTRQLERATEKVRNLEAEERAAQSRVDDLNRAIAHNGGDRIAEIGKDIAEAVARRDNCRSKHDRYAQILDALEEAPADDEAGFIEQSDRLAALRGLVAAERDRAQNDLTEASVRLKEQQRKFDALKAEIDSLKTRRSNIPEEQIRIRRDLCTALDFSEHKMPFAGELLQVKESESDWEGVAERVLGSLGKTMLVPDDLYGQVDRWVNEHHLRGRLSYFAVRARRGNEPDLDRQALAHKIAIKPDSPFSTWLRGEVAKQAGHVCCGVAELDNHWRACTRNGLIKEPGDLRIKDDRTDIGNRARYVLGWSNEAKIAALQEQMDALSRDPRPFREVEAARQRKDAADARHTSLERLKEFTDFREIDWRTAVVRIASLEAERERLRKTSDVLKQLTEDLARAEESREAVKKRLKIANDEASRVSERIEGFVKDRAVALAHVPVEDDVRAQVRAALEERITKFRNDVFAEAALLEVHTCDTAEHDTRERMQAEIDRIDKVVARLATQIVGAMKDFNAEFAVETIEVDASMDSAAEYLIFLERLQRDDLPRFERQFRDMLKENAINEIANFNAQLNREHANIEERVNFINDSLRAIPYNPGRHILLKVEPNRDRDIKEFRDSLRACTAGAIGSEDDQYSETKFLQVKDIIDRFRGRSESFEADKQWTARVTDVRNWCQFGVSEIWSETGIEFQYHDSSSGKSGGQKEKLAYTILAAGLTYQFGVKSANPGARSFSFVCIDEAFGRATEENARYGLKLFQQLGLQLLVVTPNEKVSVIEPFVRSVCFMQNSEEGDNSRLLNLTIEQYHADRELYEDMGKRRQPA